MPQPSSERMRSCHRRTCNEETSSKHRSSFHWAARSDCRTAKLRRNLGAEDSDRRRQLQYTVHSLHGHAHRPEAADASLVVQELCTDRRLPSRAGKLYCQLPPNPIVAGGRARPGAGNDRIDHACRLLRRQKSSIAATRGDRRSSPARPPGHPCHAAYEIVAGPIAEFTVSNDLCPRSQHKASSTATCFNAGSVSRGMPGDERNSTK